MGNPLQTKRRLIQMGLETTKGTPVPATVQTSFPITLDPQVQVERPDFVRGFLLNNVGSGRRIRNSMNLNIPAFPLDIHSMHIFGAMAVQGGVTPTLVGPSLANQWVFERLQKTNVLPDTFTIEIQEQNGVDIYDQEFAYGFLGQFVIDIDLNSLTRISASGFSSGGGSSTFTPALPLKVATNVPGAVWKLYLDDTWGSIGTTNVGIQIASARLTFNTGFQPFWSMVGSDTLTFTRDHFNPENAGFVLELTAIAHGAGTDLWRTEKAKAELQAARFVRLISSLDVIETVFNHELEINLSGVHEPGSYQISESQDGQQIVKMRLIENPQALSTDPWFQMRVQNAEADFT